MSRLLAAPIAALALLLIACGAVCAHEHRQVGGYEMTVGWIDEPAYAGYKNGVQLRLTDAAGKPVLDLGDSLKVEIVFGDRKTEPAALTPAFAAAMLGRPGEYRLAIIPTRPGIYAFHFVGTIRNQQVNEVFTASDQTFDPVRSPVEIEYPVKDPTTADLALRVQRMTPRVDRLNDFADRITLLTFAGIALGAAGVIMGYMAGRAGR